MASPVKPSDICAVVPNPTSPVCERLKRLLSLGEVICTFWNWWMDAAGNVSDQFKAWLAEAGVSEAVGNVSFSPDGVIPEGYLSASGQTVSRTTYAALFQRYSTKFGDGDGSTTFQLPNINGRLLIGSGTNGLTGSATRAPGDIGGAEQVTITIPQLPAHTHALPAGVVQFPGSQKANSLGNDFDYTNAPETASSGSGSPVNIMPPTFAGIWLIKY